MSFQIKPLPLSDFSPLFAIPPAELSAAHALRMVADNHPGYPCRVSLQDAEPGEEVLLVHYEHQNAATPFRASHAVYVRVNAHEAYLAINEVPEMLRIRILSLRAFDQQGMLLAADLTAGESLEAKIHEMLQDPSTAYLHIHFAKPGCYAATVNRA